MKVKVILFDGVCNLCNGLVNFVINRDRKGKFKFSSLQSSSGLEILKSVHYSRELPDSIILIDNKKILIKSDAVLAIAHGLGGFWSLFAFLKIIPRPLRDFFYDLVAKNRYKIFGTKDQCRVPENHLAERFL